MELLSAIECLVLCVFLLIFSVRYYKLEKRVNKLEKSNAESELGSDTDA